MLLWFRGAGMNRGNDIKMPWSKSKAKSDSQAFNNSLRLYIALPVKGGYRESYTWSKNRLASTFPITIATMEDSLPGCQGKQPSRLFA